MIRALMCERAICRRPRIRLADEFYLVIYRAVIGRQPHSIDAVVVVRCCYAWYCEDFSYQPYRTWQTHYDRIAVTSVDFFYW
jgi:hypothetical protein